MLELEKHIPLPARAHLGSWPSRHVKADASPAMLIRISATLNPIVTIVRGIIIMELWACLLIIYKNIVDSLQEYGNGRSLT